MDIKKLERAIVDGLEDVKAQDILVFDTERLSPLFERVIIASGTSNRQTKALASSVRETVKKRGMQVMRTEGEDNGEWIIVDCGAAVVHLMQPAIRQYYHLEEIWGGKPVKLKLGNSGTKKAAKSAKKPAKAKSADGEAVATASKKAPTRATGTKSAAAKTTGAKTAPKTAAKKAPAAKAAATKTAAKAPAKKTTTGATAAKTARKPAAKKEVVETVKVGSKKPAVKKLSPKVAAAKPAARPAAKKAAAKPAAKKTTVKTGTKSKAKA